ncbi:ResB protein required for cytochrome C biosynthesis [bacterium]|nr:ResB protein required for cytochrome C biosynthesis [bacterium]
MRKIIQGLSSLRLTVALLLLMSLLVFLMTMAQASIGVFEAKRLYIDCYWVTVSLGGVSVPILPGGKVIGAVLVINLLAAHVTRFRWGWSRVGIGLTHIGVLMLLLGSGYSSLVSRESQMMIGTGETVNFSEDNQRVELAVVSDLSPTMDRVVQVPQERLISGSTISHSSLPFTIKISEVYPNARLEMNAEVGQELPHATVGVGASVTAFPMPTVTRDDYRNVVAVFAEVFAAGKSLGTWLLSNGLGAPQTVEVGGSRFQLFIRPARYYLPYSIRLDRFTQEYYPDTTIPKYFSSRVTVSDFANHTERQSTIFMNNPLRYRGDTFYQASFGADGKSTILQVVRNRGWLFPYVSCSIIGIGLLVHFWGSLMRFWTRRVSS